MFRLGEGTDRVHFFSRPREVTCVVVSFLPRLKKRQDRNYKIFSTPHINEMIQARFRTLKLEFKQCHNIAIAASVMFRHPSSAYCDDKEEGVDPPAVVACCLGRKFH